MRNDDTYDLFIVFEQWRPIPAFPMYEVSNLGHLRKVNKDGSYKAIKASKNKLGYYCAILYDKGRKQCFYLHRLVAEAFLPPSPNGWTEINPRTEDKSFNEVFNLEYTTRKLNCNWGTRNEKIGAGHSKTVEQYDLEGNLIATYPSTRIAAEKNHVKPSCIAQCARGDSKTAYGFIWRYSSEN